MWSSYRSLGGDRWRPLVTTAGIVIYYMVGSMDKRDIDLMNDEGFWRMNEETLTEQEFVTL